MAADTNRPAPDGPPGTRPGRLVAAELEAIFLDATGLPSGPPPPDRSPGRVQALDPTRPGRAKAAPAMLGALAAIGLAGIGVGAVLVRPPQTPPPVQAPLHPAVVAAVSPAPVAPYAAPPVQQVAVPARREKPQVHRVRSSACARGACSHAGLMAADRRLRAAYWRAVDAGVARPVLADYRNRWASLRHEATYRPGRVATGYGAMASDLNRMADRRRAHRTGRPRFRTWS